MFPEGGTYDESVIAFNDEVQLLSWSETSSGGAKIVLQLHSSDALEPFRDKSIGRKAGQRYRCVMVEIGDDEQPVVRQQVGPLCRLAGMWCRRADFREWLKHSFEVTWNDVAHLGDEADVAAEVVRIVCGVESRLHIDKIPDAAQRFHDLIRRPFAEHTGEQA